MDMPYKDIVGTLALNHGHIVSMHHLKRMLQELNLFPRKTFSATGYIIELIVHQIETSEKSHRYRWMHEKCLSNRIRCKEEKIC